MVVPERPPPTAEAATSEGNALPVVAISGHIGPPEVAALCARVQGLFRDADAPEVAVDVSGVIEPDAAALDALARLHLAARRMGRHIKILHTCEQLEELVAFAGLGDVLRLKGRGQPE